MLNPFNTLCYFVKILGLILLIISAIYLSKIVYCKKHSGESAYKNPYPEFKPTFNKKPHSPDYESFGGNNLKFRHRRSPRPPEFSPGKFNKKGFSKELGYFDYRIFYISAICGIVFGILQLIGSGIYAGIVNKKVSKITFLHFLNFSGHLNVMFLELQEMFNVLVWTSIVNQNWADRNIHRNVII